MSISLKTMQAELKEFTWQIALVALGLSLPLLGAIFLLIRRHVVKPLGGEPATATELANRIATGDLSMQFSVKPGDDRSLMAAMSRMQHNLLERHDKDARTSAEMARIKNALDRVASSVMIADVDGNIIYMNDAIRKMFRDDETDIRKDLPNFTADGVIGASVDIFHRHGSMHDMLVKLTDTHRSSMKIGNHSFNLTTVPVFDENNVRQGTAVEWNERTADVAAQAEVSDLVGAANDGDFSRRIALDGKQGYLRDLGAGMNSLMDTCEVSLHDVVRVLAALAKGDLTEKIDGEYKGTWGQMKDDANATVDRLAEIVASIKESTESIATASKEIASGNADLSGRTEQQATSLEKTASSMSSLTETVRQNAGNAETANQLAAGASDVAVRGGDVVGQVVTTMS
ncbi:MAG: PAS domain-containing protein, partial [Hyphomicrobium sp.]